MSSSFLFHLLISARPRLLESPALVGQNSDSVLIAWSLWSNGSDPGDGPVTSYYIEYKKLNSTSWNEERIRATYMILYIEDDGYDIRVLPVHQDGYRGLPSPTLRVAAYKGMITFLVYFPYLQKG